MWYPVSTMRVTIRDVFSPANIVTIIGFGMTSYGSFRLNTAVGFWLVLFGRLLDVLDGPIARRTHTSRLGAVLDATVDKFTVLAITLGLFAYDLAPHTIVAYILSQNLLIALMNIVSARRKIAVESTRAGKLNIFMQMSCMILFAGGALMTGWQHTALLVVAYIAGVVSLPFAFRANTDYAAHLGSTKL